MRRLLDAALSYADRGWAVLPLQPRRKAPLGQLVRNGKDGATSDLATVLRWWTQHPRANVGLNCHESGFVALDIDPRNGGEESFWELELELGELPQTVESHSGGGGRHLLFRHPGERLVGILRDGVDVKDHGYIVAPPSIHPETGREYVWSVDGDPSEVELAEIPEAWLELLRDRFTERRDLRLNTSHADPLRNVPASVYVPKLTGRTVNAGGWCQCPFHKGGAERTPSLKVAGVVWSCFGGCRPINGRRVMGGNIYAFAALLWGFAEPLRGVDFLEVKARLERTLA